MTTPEDFSIHFINGRKRRKRAKSMAKKKSKTHRRRRRSRRSNPESVAMAPEVNRRRRRGHRRRRRSRNPSRARRAARGAFNFGLAGYSFTRDFMPRLLGKLWLVWGVKRWGNQFGGGGLFGPAQQSVQLGTSWSLGAYIAGFIWLKLGARLLGRFVNAGEFFKGGMDLMLTKVVWTEGIARNTFMVQQFGLGTADGEMMQSPDGQLYMMQGQQWQPMQGLVSASPLDGLVEASPLDGDLSYGYGHAMPASTPYEETRQAAYNLTGSPNPYTNTYMFQG